MTIYWFCVDSVQAFLWVSMATSLFCYKHHTNVQFRYCRCPSYFVAE